VPQQIEGGMAQEGEVVGRVTGTHAALVLPKSHVQDPGQAVFDAPVTADGRLDLTGGATQAGDVVARLHADARGAMSGGPHQGDAAQPGPLAVGIQVV